mmetsp:Transcript_0/g.2  ORF Transcript_0/g.2 Transcript_0/m.2 type:complete len:271 (-) Transcript_0:1134-1946(-)
MAHDVDVVCLSSWVVLSPSPCSVVCAVDPHPSGLDSALDSTLWVSFAGGFAPVVFDSPSATAPSGLPTACSEETGSNTVSSPSFSFATTTPVGVGFPSVRTASSVSVSFTAVGPFSSSGSDDTNRVSSISASPVSCSPPLSPVSRRKSFDAFAGLCSPESLFAFRKPSSSIASGGIFSAGLSLSSAWVSGCDTWSETFSTDASPSSACVPGVDAPASTSTLEAAALHPVTLLSSVPDLTSPLLNLFALTFSLFPSSSSSVSQSSFSGIPM